MNIAFTYQPNRKFKSYFGYDFIGLWIIEMLLLILKIWKIFEIIANYASDIF